ncbi:MAG: hypothetical protein QM808_03205 [Steroidobacteraceae bacterium]
MVSANPINVRGGYFGVAVRCFAMLHQPVHSRNLVAIIVNDFGYPGLTACWNFRKLANEWAALGITVLRMDLPGTADSPAIYGNCVAQWQAGVSAAINFVRSHDQNVPIVLVGLRLGAMLAINAAANQKNIASLQLIQPCLDGLAYVQQAENVAPLVVQVQYQGPEGRLLSGHFLTTEEFQSLQSIQVDLAHPAGTMDVMSFPGDGAAGFVAAAQQAGWHAELYQYDEKSEEWLIDAPLTRVPQCFGAMTQRLQTLLSEPVKVTPWELDDRQSSHGYVEQSLRCQDTDGSVQFGILTAPDEDTVPETVVILFGTASNRRTGIHDNNVYWARSLAESGIACLRFDVTGLGDSEPRLGNSDNDLLVPWNHTDADAWLQLLRQMGVRRFGAAGLSSGGYNAFQCALAHEDVVALFGINVARYVIRQSIHEVISTQVKTSSSYVSALVDPKTWLRLLKGEVAVKRIAAALSRRLMAALRTRIKMLHVNRSNEAVLGEAHGNMLNILKREGARVTLLYSVGDAYYFEFEQEFGPRGESLTQEDNFKLVLLAGADHSLSHHRMARQIADLLRDFFREALPETQVPDEAERRVVGGHGRL